MSELSPIRTIPSRVFEPVFLSGQQIKKSVTDSWVPKFSGGKVSFGLGVVNGIVPSNWSEEFNKPDANIRYVKIEVTANINGVQSVELFLEAAPNVSYEYNKEYPPVKFKFILGAIKGTTYSMAFTGPINVTPYEAFRVPKSSAPSPGQSPYDHYWGWQVN